ACGDPASENRAHGASGLGTRKVSEGLSCSCRNMRKWKARFSANPSAESLEDQERSGRPAQIPVEIRCKIACERPAAQESPAPLRDVWTYESLARSLEEQTDYRLSVSEVGRILRFEKIQPHRIRRWVKSSAPNFLPKAKRICNLYINIPKNSVVICVDEEPMQVLEREHPTRVDPSDGSVRYEYKYKRHGTQSLFAAINVKTGSMFGRVVQHRTADALVSFMNALARRYPKKKIFVLWANLNTHYDWKDKRWTKFNKRHGGRFRFIYTPIHASWMNQVEIRFSIIERRI
ncbi:MAG: IS630 family transposase, partial [Myxococcales bacterium]|nr:IS630 family transposase [Myxococcales bacterium]